jgi:ABC-type transporter Mla subunit MlaD
MNELRRNLIVGLFVLFGLSALATLIILFGQQPTWLTRRDAYSLNIHFDSAAGIRPGTIVTVGGITIGRVLEVGFRDPDRFHMGVNVLVQFDRPYPLRQGTYARTTEPGLGAGRPPVILVPPGDEAGEVLPSGATIQGELIPAVDALFPASVRASFETTAQRIGEAAAALTPVLEDLHQIFQPRSTAEVDRPDGLPGNISTAVARLDQSFKHFNEVLGDPNVQSNLKKSLENIHAATEDARRVAADFKTVAGDAQELTRQAREFMGSAQNTLTRIDENVERIGRDLTNVLDQGSQLLDQATALARRTNAGQGTLGKLFTDDRLFESMVLTFRRMAETVEEFRVLAQEWQKGRIRVAF